MPAHLPYTFGQRAALRLEDAIHILDGLGQILDDDRFTNSPLTEYRDAEKANKHKAILTALRGTIREAAEQLDFDGVFLENKS